MVAEMPCWGESCVAGVTALWQPSPALVAAAAAREAGARWQWSGCGPP